MSGKSAKILMAAIFVVVLAFIIMPSSAMTSSPSHNNEPSVTSGSSIYGSYVYSTSPSVANVSVYMPFGTNNTTSLRDITVVIYGSVSYNVSDNGKAVQTGFTTSEEYVNFTLGNGTYNLSVDINGSPYGSITDLHTTSFASMYSVEGVYIYSVYPGQAQQLYAAPGQTDILMYPTWNITMYSSVPAAYTIYVNGAFVSGGKFVGTKVFSVDVNTSIGSAVIGIGNTVYKFNNLPISSVPLRKYYAPPSPALLFSAQVLDEYLVKTAVASGLSLIAAILIIGRITVSKIERTVVG